jgi:hypothetical protein
VLQRQDYQIVQVLIEWRGPFRMVSGTGPRERLDSLVRMLHSMADECEINSRETTDVARINLGVLPSIGWTVSDPLPAARSIGMVFKTPNNTSRMPVSLFERIEKDTLSKPPKAPALGVRFRLALTLAKLYGNVLAVGCLHRGVRSHNVIFFHDEHLSAPYLTGFVESRPEESEQLSSLINEEAGSYELYRPPGTASKNGIQDDMYGLGVMLLEIGLWKTASRIQGRAGLQELHEQIIPHNVSKLSYRAGNIYRDAVLKCLDNVHQQSDEARIDYAGAVIAQLARCCA